MGLSRWRWRDPDPHGPGPPVLHVATDGDDILSGESWSKPKRTLGNAVTKLADNAAAGVEGKIILGDGEFAEDPIIADQKYTIRGQSPERTTVKLNSAGHLLSFSDTFADAGHWINVEDLRLHGGTVTGSYDLLRIREGGFNTAVRNVQCTAAPRYGIHVERNAFCFYAVNLTGDDCVSGLFRLDLYDQASLAQLILMGLQIDRCGQYPIQIVDEGPGNNVALICGVEAEAAAGAGEHDALIYYEPLGGGNGMRFDVRSITAVNEAASDLPSVIYEASGVGGAASWVARNVLGDGYTDVFKSDKLNRTIPWRNFDVESPTERFDSALRLVSRWGEEKVLRVGHTDGAFDALAIRREGQLLFGDGFAEPDINVRRLSDGALHVLFSGTDHFQFEADGQLRAQTLGVGNHAAASVLGNVVGKVEIFDTAGTSLGFLPVYDSIT